MIFFCLLFGNGCEIFRYFLFFRTISRSLEIIIAFGNDTLQNKPQKSSLDKYDRISLAVHSYIDVILMYASLYYAFKFERNSINLIESLLDSIGIMTFSNFFDEFSKYELYKKMIVYLQVITSFVLVSVSFAIYIGREDKNKKA